MNIYYYPRFQIKTILEKAATHILFITLIIISLKYRKDSLLLGIVGTQWLIYIVTDVRDYWHHKQGWLAKIDNTFIYLGSNKNKTPINEIRKIERQIIQSKNFGINIIYKNGHVRSEQFPRLDEQHIDGLVEFLKRAIMQS